MTPLERMQGIVAGHLDDIKALFKPGIKIAVMVRTPGAPDRDFIMTDDTDAELIAMINRRMGGKP
jgi:hypothetical protein